jgi:hypothetical protein
MKTMKTTKEAKKCFKLVIAAAIASTSLSGCGTITNAHVRHMDNKTLALRRYQLARKNTGRFAWGNAYGDMQDDQREQEAIEREMMKRGLLNPVATPQEIRPTPEIEYGNPRPNI